MKFVGEFGVNFVYIFDKFSRCFLIIIVGVIVEFYAVL